MTFVGMKEEMKEYIRAMRNALKKLKVAIDKNDYDEINLLLDLIGAYCERMQSFREQYNLQKEKERRMQQEVKTIIMSRFRTGV